jgi:hypothetical protein
LADVYSAIAALNHDAVPRYQAVNECYIGTLIAWTALILLTRETPFLMSLCLFCLVVVVDGDCGLVKRMEGLALSITERIVEATYSNNKRKGFTTEIRAKSCKSRDEMQKPTDCSAASVSCIHTQTIFVLRASRIRDVTMDEPGGLSPTAVTFM